MAVIEWMDPGVSITIRSAGNTLTEHSPPADHSQPTGKTKLWYIECEAGEFSILFNVKDPFRLGRQCSKLAFEIYIDGKKATELQLANTDYEQKHHYNWTYECFGRETKISKKKDTVKPFKFTEIQTKEKSDKKRMDDEKRKLCHAGDIVIKLYRKSYGKALKPSIADDDTGVPKSVLEASLKGKAISHGISFDKEKPMKKYQRWDNEYKDGQDLPISIFHFKYRSRDALIAEGVISRDHSPTPPLAAAQTYHDLTREQQAKAFALLCKSEGYDPPKVKREVKEDHEYAPRAKKPCIIDLSNDDNEPQSSISPTPDPTPTRRRESARCMATPNPSPASAKGKAKGYTGRPASIENYLFVDGGDDSEL